MPPVDAVSAAHAAHAAMRAYGTGTARKHRWKLGNGPSLMRKSGTESKCLMYVW